MMSVCVCMLTIVMGHHTSINGEKWCYTNGNGECTINGKAHPCPTCGNYAKNGCRTYPPTTSPDKTSSKKDYSVACQDTTPKAGNTCIKEKCFGYVFECMDGYVVEKTGKREYNLTCSKGQYQWAKCVKATCTAGSAPHATPASTTEISVGQSVEYTCNPNFSRQDGARKYTATCSRDGTGGYALNDVTGCSEKLGCMDSSAINFVSDATRDDPAHPCHECTTSADCGENASCESHKCTCAQNHAGQPGKGGRCFSVCGDHKCLQREACIDSSGNVFCACGKSADDCATVTISPEELACGTFTKYACDNKSECSWDTEEGTCVSTESGAGAYKKEDDDGSTNWGLIGGILFVVLLVLLCCCFLLCTWLRKRERKDQGFAEDRRHWTGKDRKDNVGSSAGSVGSSRSPHKSNNKRSGSKNKMNSSGGSRTHRNRGIE